MYPKENDYKNIRLEADLALNTIPANKKSALNSSKIPSNDPDFAWAKESKLKNIILLFLNELRSQLSKKWKQQASVLTKLWTLYFDALQNDHKKHIKQKNKQYSLLLDKFKLIKEQVQSRDQQLGE